MAFRYPWFLHFSRRFSRARGVKSLDELLDGEQRRITSSDPNTSVQWEKLARGLEIERTGTTPAHVRPAYRKPAIAFALVAAAVLATVFMLHRNSQSYGYATGTAQQSSVVLADSTEVTLNHTSSLVVEPRGSEGQRNVTLNGEAFFRVRNNGTRFIVQTRLGVVIVLGTEFDVRVRENQFLVAVLKGRVLVDVVRNGHDSTLAVGPGEIVSCTGSDYPGLPAPNPFPEYPGWMHGKFYFYKTRLISACQEIESQVNVVVRIENPQLREETIPGAVDGVNVESALTTLSILTGSSYRHENNAFILR